MLAHTLRPARFVPAVSHFSSSARRLHRLLRASADKLISLSLYLRLQLRQTVRHASVGGSSQTPIQDDKRDLRVKVQEHSNALVFGGLAAVGATALWWMMADTSGTSDELFTLSKKGGDDEVELTPSLECAQTLPSRRSSRRRARTASPPASSRPRTRPSCR